MPKTSGRGECNFMLIINQKHTWNMLDKLCKPNLQFTEHLGRKQKLHNYTKHEKTAYPVIYQAIPFVIQIV